MTVKQNRIENLVFEGGGVRGIAYAGAVQALNDNGLLSGVQRVAGTSAGAFTALLLSLSYSPAEARQALLSIQFKSLEDKPNPLRVATHYGLYKGAVLYDWIAEQLSKKGLSAELTFLELAQQGARELKVFATDLNRRDAREFSAEKTPHASVTGAVRASMSIPLLYSAWQFPNGIPDNHIYVDGGTVYNYPINAFDSAEGVNPHTLGFYFVNNQEQTQTAEQPLDNLFEFSKSLFATALNAQRVDRNHDPEQTQRSVLIDSLGYKATDLDLTEKEFERLFVAGRNATITYLNTR